MFVKLMSQGSLSEIQQPLIIKATNNLALLAQNQQDS